MQEDFTNIGDIVDGKFEGLNLEIEQQLTRLQTMESKISDL
jgi:hypothetical protein